VSRSATQLPPGRHGLSRAEVARSQRDRLLVAMAEVVAERGYATTSVADVIERAGVSRETFYQQFTDKTDCFLSAFDHVVAQLTSRVLAAMEDTSDGAPPDDRLARLDRALAVYLDVLSREPAMARTFLIEVYGAGPAAVRRRVAVFHGFVELLAEAFETTTPEQRVACEALAGAISSMVTTRVALDDHQGLPPLREPLMRIARRLLSDDSGP
jgi:AcrR family transcriptional regulator